MKRGLLIVGGVVVASIAIVAAAATLFVISSRGNQELTLPGRGETLPTTQPRAQEVGDALVSETGLEQGSRVRRAAIVSPPDAHEGEQFPVVFVLHGHSTSPGQAMQWGGWGQAVVERRFIAVIPEGVGQSWNAGGCCRTATTLGMDDVSFLEALVSDMKLRPEVDADSVFMAGDSNGGMMAYRYACTNPSTVVSIASVNGTNVSDCDPTAGTDVLHIAGTADQVVPYEGGRSVTGLAFATAPFPGVVDSMTQIASSLGCAELPSAGDTGSIATDRWADCSSDSTVELITVTGGQHQWPTGEPLDATTTVLDFFGI
jgi:polyhydroxybutyrate depolymerase